jgi:hypothetical protein
MSGQFPRSRKGGMSSQSMSWSETRELLEEYPIASTLLAFGAGMGMGILIGQTVANAFAPEPTPSSRLDSLTQQVCNAVRNAIPEAVSRHLQR